MGNNTVMNVLPLERRIGLASIIKMHVRGRGRTNLVNEMNVSQMNDFQKNLDRLKSSTSNGTSSATSIGSNVDRQRLCQDTHTLTEVSKEMSGRTKVG